MNITLKQLRAFISVAKYQHFTMASQQLHISQSALSGLIKELETTLGFQLFERSTRQLTLSAMGEQLLPKAQRIINELSAFESEVITLNNLEQGQVRIAVSQQFSASTMPILIAKFKKIYPNIQITLIDCSVEAVISQVQNMEVDFGLGAERAFDDDISATFLFELPFYVVMPTNHPLATQAEIRWEQLLNEPIISLQGPFTQLLLQELPANIANFMSKPAYQVNFLPTALGLTREGLGLTLCLSYASDRVKRQGLIMRPLIEPTIQRRFFLYQRDNRSFSPAMTVFKEFLHTEIEKILLKDYD